MIALALALAALVGVSLGLLGGGGSILTLPLLTYVLEQDAHAAIAGSLFVVGVTSLVGLVPHARAGRVRWKTGVIFGGASMVGAYLAGRVAKLLPPEVLLILFGVMMLVTAVAMLKKRKLAETTARPLSVPKVLAEGLAVGAVTGLVGAGGGFLVVPALVILGGLPMHAAVGTSLLVIAMKAFAGFAGHAAALPGLDWPILLAVTGLAVVGSLAGARLAPKIPQDTLRRAFGWFVVAMGVFILAQELPSLIPPISDSVAAVLVPLGGGALIGLAATLFLWSHGRVAGISGLWGGLVTGAAGRSLRMSFMLGLVSAGLVAFILKTGFVPETSSVPFAIVAFAGLLVGYGTRLGNGCTSGHGVCGIARLSPRSLIATGTFMATGVLTVLAVRQILGGW